VATNVLFPLFSLVEVTQRARTIFPVCVSSIVIMSCSVFLQFIRTRLPHHESDRGTLKSHKSLFCVLLYPVDGNLALVVTKTAVEAVGMGSEDTADASGGILPLCRSIVKVLVVVVVEKVVPVLQMAFSVAFRARTGREVPVEEPDDPRDSLSQESYGEA
jgi:hypothetical protein